MKNTQELYWIVEGSVVSYKFDASEIQKEEVPTGEIIGYQPEFEDIYMNEISNFLDLFYNATNINELKVQNLNGFLKELRNKFRLTDKTLSDVNQIQNQELTEYIDESQSYTNIDNLPTKTKINQIIKTTHITVSDFEEAMKSTRSTIKNDEFKDIIQYNKNPSGFKPRKDNN